MYDLQRIGKLIADINNYIKELDSFRIKAVSDLSDSKTYHASSMVLFSILNRLIDFGGEIIAAEKLKAPERYKDIMPSLAKAGVMNKETAEKLNALIEERNVLAHFYGEMTEKKLFKMINEIGLLEEFIRLVKKRVKFV